MEPENPALDDYVLGARRRAAAEDLPAADRVRRRRGADPPVPRHVRLARLRADAHLAVPARQPPGAAARDAARAGRDLRRRRLDARAARGLARARPGRRSCASAGSPASCSPACRRARCAGSSGASRRSLGAPAPSPGLGFLPGSLSVHMDGEPGAPARLPRGDRRRHDPARLRGRRRRRAAVPRGRARRGQTQPLRWK